MKPAKKKPGKEVEGGTLVRISRNDKDILQALAHEEGEPMPRILHKALEVYRRQKFLDQVNVAYQNLKQREEAWYMETSERKLWGFATHDDTKEKDEGG